MSTATSPYTFHAIVQKPKRNSTWRIQIGGQKTCVIFNVEQFRGRQKAYLEGIAFYPECVANNTVPLVRGSGTTRLLKAALTFVYQLLPKVEYIYFKDTSRIDCKRIADFDDDYVKLHIFYISKNGKTWYEQVLGARLDDEHMETYEKKKAAALGPYRDEFGFDSFKNIYMNSVKHVFPRRIMQIIKNAYNANQTYGAMFSQLARENDCSIMYGWLDSYFHRNLSILFDNEYDWHVSRERFEYANIEWNEIAQMPVMKPLPHFGGRIAYSREFASYE
jgi:hypothetical protein